MNNMEYAKVGITTLRFNLKKLYANRTTQF